MQRWPFGLRYVRKRFHSDGGKPINIIPLEGRSLNELDFLNFLDNHYNNLSFNITEDAK